MSVQRPEVHSKEQIPSCQKEVKQRSLDSCTECVITSPIISPEVTICLFVMLSTKSHQMTSPVQN
jgi:hypothetical protein